VCQFLSICSLLVFRARADSSITVLVLPDVFVFVLVDELAILW